MWTYNIDMEAKQVVFGRYGELPHWVNFTAFTPVWIRIYQQRINANAYAVHRAYRECWLQAASELRQRGLI